MKVGFIGTGVITEAIVTGLLASDFPVSQILVSLRGRETSTRLAASDDRIHICDDNQRIADSSDIIFLAVRPHIAEQVLTPLQFRPGSQVASLIAALPIEKLHQWIGPSVTITRAIPLPAVAKMRGVTAIYPESKVLVELFSALGGAVTAATIEEFNAYAAASAMMGTYFGLLDATAHWLCRHAVDNDSAWAYLVPLFRGLAETAAQTTNKDFEDLRLGHTTPGGLNQQLFDVYAAEGGLTALTRGLDSVYERVVKVQLKY
jgi:pyrroline-5-carboxylate reductase